MKRNLKILIALTMTASLMMTSCSGTKNKAGDDSSQISDRDMSYMSDDSRDESNLSDNTSGDVPDDQTESNSGGTSGGKNNTSANNTSGGTSSTGKSNSSGKTNSTGSKSDDISAITQVTPPGSFSPNAAPALAAGVPKRTPTTLGNMTMNNLYYKAKQHTGTVDLVDLRGVDGSVRIAALCLQGLVTRNSTASIYFLTADTDEFWKDYTAKTYGVKFSEITANDMFYKYAKFVKKFVIYDWASMGQDPYQMVMAINMAAISDGLPVTEGFADFVIDEGWFSKSLASENITKKWSNAKSAYDWGIKNVLPQCNKNYVGACDTNDTIWDYLYATKSFSFWLDYKKSDERALIDRIFDAGYTMPGLLFGYGEGGDDLLHAADPKGFTYVVSDYFANASYFSSIPVTTAKYAQNPINSSLKGTNGVMYVSLYISDGDNIQFNQKASQVLWEKTERGKNPVAIEINPGLYELAPPLLNYYETNRTTNDELMGGPAGFGYIWEHEFKTSAWDAWHAINNFFLGKADFRTVASSHVPEVDATINFMKKSSIIGALDWGDPNEADVSFSGNAKLYNGKPIIVSKNCGRDIAVKFDGITPTSSRPTFYSLCVTQAALGEGSGGYKNGYAHINSEIATLKKKYGDKIQFVLPSDLLTMAKNHLS